MLDRCPCAAAFLSLRGARLEALERGVSCRSVYEPGVLRDEALFGAVRQSAHRGERARLSNRVPACVILRDGEEYLMLVEGARTGGTVRAVIGAHPSTLAFLGETFDAIWESSMPLDDDRLAADDLLNPEEREILSLLGLGLTDEAVARRLEVSARTVQRRVREIQRSLGAVSRFQLGAITAILRQRWSEAD